MSEPKLKSARHHKKTVSLPRRSETRPSSGMTSVYAIKYALTIQAACGSSLRREIPRSKIIWGRTVVTTVRSLAATSTPSNMSQNMRRDVDDMSGSAGRGVRSIRGRFDAERLFEARQHDLPLGRVLLAGVPFANVQPPHDRVVSADPDRE